MRNPFRFLGAMLMAILATGCGEKIQPGTTAKDPGPPLAVQTAVARIESAPGYYEAVGTVQARQTATLAAKVMGTIHSVNAREGDVVARGAVLISITAPQIDAGFTGARAGLEAATGARDAAAAARRAAAARSELATSTYRRYQALASGESASARELDEVKSGYDAANAALARAEAALEAAEQQVVQAQAAVVAAAADRGDALVRAPFDGRVTARLAEPGDLAAPGRPLLTVEADEGFRVETLLPEDRIASVHPGQPLEVNLPALGPRWIQAPVETILPTADSATRSVAVRIGMPPLEGISTGLFARVRVPARHAAMLQVPQSAVVRTGQLTGVFTVDASRTARFSLVRTGAARDGRIEILSGLSDGQRFVTAPPPELTHGRRIEEAA